MNLYQGHDSRDRRYGGSCDSCDSDGQTTRTPIGPGFPACPAASLSSLPLTTTTTTDFAFDCSSGVAKSCDLVLAHPHPLLCAGAYFWICITDVSRIPSDDVVSPMVYNPRRIQVRAQRQTTRKRIHLLNLMNTAIAPAGAHAYLLVQLEEPAIHLHRPRRECYPSYVPFLFLF